MVCGVRQWRLRPPGRPSPPRVPIHRGGQVTHSFHAAHEETSNAHRRAAESNGPAECVAAVGIQRRGRQPSSAAQAVVSDDVPRRLLIGDQPSETCPPSCCVPKPVIYPLASPAYLPAFRRSRSLLWPRRWRCRSPSPHRLLPISPIFFLYENMRRGEDSSSIENRWFVAWTECDVR